MCCLAAVQLTRTPRMGRDHYWLGMGHAWSGCVEEQRRMKWIGSEEGSCTPGRRRNEVASKNMSGE